MVVSIVVPFASGTYLKTIQAYHFSLGNSSCFGSNCNSAIIYFNLPQGIPEERFKVSVSTDCYSPPANSSEVYNVTVFCNDKNEFRAEIDLHNLQCTNNYYNFTITSEEQSMFVLDEKVFNSFFCLFTRDSANTDRIPTSLHVYVEPIAFNTGYESEEESEARSTLTQSTVILGDLVDLNVRIWRLLYIVFEIVAIVFGIYIVFYGVPRTIRWLIEKIAE